ncbi:MAG: DUF2798 domain-containing protein [Haliea sp.]|nr:MAG: DUF2798 domain-containing protein [Haliea sp.]
MIPKKYEPYLFGLILSGLMSLVVSGIATVKVAGFGPSLPGLWLDAWLTSWLVAFPTVLVVAPFTRRVVGRLVAR